MLVLTFYPPNMNTMVVIFNLFLLLPHWYELELAITNASGMKGKIGENREGILSPPTRYSFCLTSTSAVAIVEIFSP